MKALAEGCKICGRVAFGELVLLPSSGELREFRHEHCGIGSEEWALYFAQLPMIEQGKLAEFHRLYVGVSVHYNNSTKGESNHV